MTKLLDGKRALITDADRYMGVACDNAFRREGADVILNTDDLREHGACDRIVKDAGAVDILVANLAEDGQEMTLVTDITDADWMGFFDHLAHPLMKLTRAVVPGMIKRGGGKIVAVTSAAPLRGIPKASAYCAARGAQNAFVRAAGIELARHNIQLNAIAQNYVENPSYYPEEMLADKEMMARILKVVPAKRLAKPWESAALAVFLASEKSDFICGQVIPFAGGWVTST